MLQIVSFPDAEPATYTQVGGKGFELIQMTKAGLPVPPGKVLTASFFAPWFDEIKASETWAALIDTTPDKWSLLCTELKRLGISLRLTKAQQRALADLHKDLSASGENALFAVRSSSPDEDLASASFAGGYETRLGVRLTELEEAVRYCFASSLGERVFIYKKEHGFDILSPGFAVVVQQQIDSSVSGVAFSMNPLTNDYDEAVVDANWGLGESVVAGLASPDHFIIDKVGRRVIEKKLGSKQTSIWLRPEGGTLERDNHRSAEFTLTDAQLSQLTDIICRIEVRYGKPMDIEWAYTGGQLHVLQARPITTYVPLLPDMMTRPGERRRLYADGALSKGLTINQPVSPMGLAWMEDMYLSLIDSFVGESLQRDVTPAEAAWFFAGGRMYLNLSNIMWLASPRRMSRSVAANDALMADLLANVDEKRYRAAEKPSWVGFSMLRLIPKLMWRLRGFFGNMLWALLAPRRAQRAYQQRLDAYKADLSENIDYSLPFEEFRRTFTSRMTRELFGTTMSVLIAALIAIEFVDYVVHTKSSDEKALLEKLKLGFAGNVVVEMGITLFRLARLLDKSDFEDLTGLTKRIEDRQVPDEFLSAWDAFIATYGCRGPMEMDLASPHYGDDPCLALRQMSFMISDEAGFDPEVTHKHHMQERRQACEILIRRSGRLRRSLLRHVYTVIDLFAGTRDTPKHQMLMFHYAVRKRVLIEGKRLVVEGRLDAAEDVFDLTIRDLESAASDTSLDLRAIRKERTRFLNILKTHVTEFPPVIDSRGRILRPPPREEKPGELSGMAVSPGVVTGPVKVLSDPHSKPVIKGDVLVAYTTDPGWTPLFVNAAAIVLEVGGILQHGAVIAREYGKPCVVGIDRVIHKLHDGQQVEVDGTAGVIRQLT